jgi:HK97 gp10 family phage protein
MASSITVHVRSRIPALTAAGNALAAAATAKAAHDMVAIAQTRARVDTGNMKNSINAQGDGTNWSVHSPAEYSVFNEFGTSKMGAQPFMIPAKEQVEPAYLAALKQLIP